MFKSNTFGRIFWFDINNDFRSCPLKVDNTGDFTQVDYVEEWTDLEGLELGKLLNIYKTELINNEKYGGSLSFNDFDLTENVYNEVKKCYNSSNLEDEISYIDSLLTAGIWHGK